MNRKGEIILISGYKFPDGDAGSVRFFYFAKTLQRLGYDVLVVGYGPITDREECFKGVPYLSMRREGRYRSYLSLARRTRSFLEKRLKEREIHSVIIGSSPINQYAAVIRFCSAHAITLIKDAVEWYSAKQFKRGIFAQTYIMKTVENRFLTRKPIRVIAISRYLETYFSSKGCPTERIPIYFDLKDFDQTRRGPDGKLRLIYAGSSGHKDYLATMLRGLALLPGEQLCRVEFRIFGVSADAVRAILNDSALFEKIRPLLKIEGRQPRELILRELASSDFSILLRDARARYAKAGFPTKVIESIAVGTPVICNYSSDLQDFLIDERNALIVDGSTPEAFAQTVQRAIQLTPEKKRLLAGQAKLTSRQFDIDCYAENFRRLLS